MNTKGFTLIEVIISIMIMSIAAVLMLNYLNTGFARSGDPLIVLDDNYSALQAIEIVNADYRARLESNPAQSMNRYVGNDLSTTITGLSGPGVKGEFVGFSNPDVNRRVNEISATGGIYVKITASSNNKTIVTLLGN